MSGGVKAGAFGVGRLSFSLRGAILVEKRVSYFLGGVKGSRRGVWEEAGAKGAKKQTRRGRNKQKRENRDR